MSAAVRYRLSPDASVAELDGESVVLHLRTGRFFRVNRGGAPLLTALASANGASGVDLADALVARFGIDRARATADVDHWLGLLKTAGLLANDDRGPGPAP